MKNPYNVSFYELLLWTNKSTKDVALLSGKSERTIKKWIKTNKPCKATRTLLIWLHKGIPQNDKWIGWKIRDNDLISPGGFTFNAKHLEILPMLHQWRSEKEAEYNKIRFDAHKQIKEMSYFT